MAAIAGSLLSGPGECRRQCLVQGSVHEVVADVRVDGQGADALVADLLLDEPPVHPVLGQMRDVRVAKSVRGQLFVQPQGIPVCLETVVIAPG